MFWLFLNNLCAIRLNNGVFISSLEQGLPAIWKKKSWKLTEHFHSWLKKNELYLELLLDFHVLDPRILLKFPEYNFSFAVESVKLEL